MHYDLVVFSENLSNWVKGRTRLKYGEGYISTGEWHMGTDRGCAPEMIFSFENTSSNKVCTLYGLSVGHDVVLIATSAFPGNAGNNFGQALGLSKTLELAFEESLESSDVQTVSKEDLIRAQLTTIANTSVETSEGLIDS